MSEKTTDPGLSEEFLRWAHDPTRTSDQLCLLELLLELGDGAWRHAHGEPPRLSEPGSWERKKARANERRDNPALRPLLDGVEAARTAEMCSLIGAWHEFLSDDRPVRDLEVLRFLPNLRSLEFGSVEVVDLTPLAGLKHLENLRLQEAWDAVRPGPEDFSPLSGLKRLKQVSLGLRAPWPDLSALAHLPELETLTLHVNPLALMGVGVLGRVRTLTVSADFHHKTPIRSMRDLPEMPELVSLKFEGVASLDGIERYPNLRNLDLIGRFRDLRPLEALKKVQSLRLENPVMTDLAPVARMPELHQLLLVRETPIDVGPLAESVSLREVRQQHCPIIETELAALNAGLLPWDNDFAIDPPRALPALRYFVVDNDEADFKSLPPATEQVDPRKEAFGGDESLQEAETRWFEKQLKQRLKAALGPNAKAGIWGRGGSLHLSLPSADDSREVHEVIEITRQLMARCRYRWTALLSVEDEESFDEGLDELADDEEGGSTRPPWQHEETPESLAEEQEQFRKEQAEKYARMEREHRLSLLEQQGAAVDPAEFATEQKASMPGDAMGHDDDDLEDYDNLLDDEDEGAGEDDEESILSEGFGYIVFFDEAHLWIRSHMLEEAEYGLGIKAENWHALPEPPAERPRPI